MESKPNIMNLSTIIAGICSVIAIVGSIYSFIIANRIEAFENTIRNNSSIIRQLMNDRDRNYNLISKSSNKRMNDKMIRRLDEHEKKLELIKEALSKLYPD